MSGTKVDEWLGADYREWPEEERCFRMATKAEHLLGDLSREEPNLCAIHGECGDSYVGSWMTGYGFINLKFPKETTRLLTPEEHAKLNGRRLAINETVYGPISIDDRDVDGQVRQ